MEQLEAGGVIVAPLWLRTGLQASVAFKEEQGGLESVTIEPCGFMRLRGPGAGNAAYEQMGTWTVSFDEPNQERATLLRALLQEEPTSLPPPPLSPGWFTPIALGEPHAVHLFSLGLDETVVACGILEPSPPGLAVVASRAGRASIIETFGSEEVSGRLLKLLQSEDAVELRDLTIAAVPAVQEADTNGAMATLARPNFSLVVSRN